MNRNTGVPPVSEKEIMAETAMLRDTGVPSLGDVPPVAKLFAENAGRFLVEVAPENREAFIEIIKDIPASEIGKVTDTGRIVIKDNKETVVDVSIADTKQAWQGTFDW